MIKLSEISATSEEDRAVLTRLCSGRGLCVDIGTFRAGTALTMLRAGVGHVATIDAFDGRSGGVVVESWPKGALIIEALSNLSEFDASDYTFIIGNSLQVADEFFTGNVDFVFLDGAHDYESVKNDIRAWLPKIGRGGIIAGHDYEMPSQHANKLCLDTHFMHDECHVHGIHPGVIRAVDEEFGDIVKHEAHVWWVEL